MTETMPVREGKAGGRPTRQEAEHRLARLLDIARRHFLAVGYGETSLDNIAREAGIAKKTLYHHFGSKAGLFTAILQALRDSWMAELRDIIVLPGEPQIVLQAVALHLLQVGTRPEIIALYRLLVAEAHRVPDFSRGHYANGSPRGMEPLAGYLREAVATGILEIDDIALATEQFTHLVLGGIRLRLLFGAVRRPNRSERERIARQAVRMFLTGCHSHRVLRTA